MLKKILILQYTLVLTIFISFQSLSQENVTEISSGSKDNQTYSSDPNFSEIVSVAKFVFNDIEKNFVDKIDPVEIEKEGIENLIKGFSLKKNEDIVFKGTEKSLSENLRLIIENDLIHLEPTDGLSKRDFLWSVFDKTMDYTLNGMFSSTKDPYSFYLPKENSSALSDIVEGNFGGIGAVIRKINFFDEQGKVIKDKGYIKVVQILKNSPAKKAGLQPGDRIISIANQSTVDMTSSRFSQISRGVIGTDVDLVLLRDKNQISLTIKRDTVNIETIKYSRIQDTDIGYVAINEFVKTTAVDFMNAINDLEKEKSLSYLILDLRGNPGGLLNSALSIADLFIDKGILLGIKDRKINREKKASVSKYFTKDIPMVILLNGGSASASEILAGALKDTAKAYLIGQKSFGKGKIQQVSYIKNGKYGMYRLTTQRYYTPAGTFIDKVGIVPNLEIELPKIDIPNEEFSDKIGVMYYYLQNYLENLDEKKGKIDTSSKEYIDLIDTVKSKTSFPRYYIETQLSVLSDEKILVYNDTLDIELLSAIEMVKDKELFDKIKKDEKKTIKVDDIYNSINKK